MKKQIITILLCCTLRIHSFPFKIRYPLVPSEISDVAKPEKFYLPNQQIEQTLKSIQEQRERCNFVRDWYGTCKQLKLMQQIIEQQKAQQKQ